MEDLTDTFTEQLLSMYILASKMWMKWAKKVFQCLIKVLNQSAIFINLLHFQFAIDFPIPQPESIQLLLMQLNFQLCG